MKTKTIDTNRDITSLLPSWVTEVAENKQYGEVPFDLKKMELYMSDKQKTGYISGTDLRKEMQDKSPVNLAYLQFFVDNPKLFPKEWKGQYIYGWGTIVRNDRGGLDVPCLVLSDGRVVLDWRWLGYGWGSACPALRFASSDLGTQSSALALEPLPLDLDSAIKICKENGLKVIKEY